MQKPRSNYPPKPLAIGDVVVLGYGSGPIQWEVTELTSKGPRLRSIPTKRDVAPVNRHPSWHSIRRGMAERINGVPILEAEPESSL